MWEGEIAPFLLGVLVTCSMVAGLFFLRFWRRTRERLFVFFAVSFWLLALNWLLVAFIHQDEAVPAVFLVRLAAFGLILVGVVDKNRAGPHNKD